ncbi:hypothetical protein V5F49_04400 [Xanthobacter sp. V3C-3]|uniref:hypothetical protein n=1 Tax=Xanthobacter lutulentifluminis TaxID=3119935 RepID=UPI00372A559D
MIQPLRPPAPPQPVVQQPRLGGALAILFWCACGITAVPLAGLFALISDLGAQGAVSALFDSFAGPGATQVVLRLGLLPHLVLFVWAVTMVALTVARARVALTVLPWILVLWAGVSIYSQFAIRNALSPGGADLGAFAGLLPALLSQVVGVAAFFGYFREGRRPQAYYVR